MSKHTPRKAFARAAGARDPRNPADPAAPPAGAPARGPEPAPEPAPESAPESNSALAVPPDSAAPPPAQYDPADYRWVPVRRRPRLDGWTEEKQRRFIETLADTGLVGAAAKAVGMSRESAYRLRRAAHGAAFARAWDAARHHAGGLVEDIAFERAIEGTEQEVLDSHGNVIATRLLHDNRLLRWLLCHLKPERYGRARAPGAAPQGMPEPAPILEEHLRAMEPALPAPPEQMLDAETLAAELQLADAADGILPHFLGEQRRPVPPERQAAEAAAARNARGAAAWEKQVRGEALSDDEFADACFHLDPVSNGRPRAAGDNSAIARQADSPAGPDIMGDWSVRGPGDDGLYPLQQRKRPTCRSPAKAGAQSGRRDRYWRSRHR